MVVLLAPYVRFHNLNSVWATEYPLIGIIAAHSAYNMFYKYMHLIVNLVFSTSVFGMGITF